MFIKKLIILRMVDIAEVFRSPICGKSKQVCQKSISLIYIQ